MLLSSGVAKIGWVTCALPAICRPTSGGMQESEVIPMNVKRIVVVVGFIAAVVWAGRALYQISVSGWAP